MTSDNISENVKDPVYDEGISIVDRENPDEIEMKTSAPTASRSDFQFGRRLFHASIGLFVATTYWMLFTHQRAIYLLGMGACIFYVFEQIRINYPEAAGRIRLVNKYFLRGEEYLKESSGMPYVMAILLTIISFPQPIALVAIYTLAIGDPMAAIVGISIGKHQVVKNKSVEGSIAFFLVSFFFAFVVLFIHFPEGMTGKILGVSFLLALFATLFEMIPLKIDDNLTIPLFCAVMLWVLCSFAGIPV